MTSGVSQNSFRLSSREEEDRLVMEVLQDNELRRERLESDFDPISGKGAPLDRVKLEISDFAIPVQYVPVEMMNNKLIKEIAKYGSIQTFLEKHKFKGDVPTFHEMELRIRRIRHKYDFIFWAYFCIHIKAKIGGDFIRFKLNYAQVNVLVKCEELRKSDLPIDIIICKARQWGGSTFSIFYQAWIAFKWRPAHSFVVAAQNKSVAAEITRMLSKAMRLYPAWDLGLPEGESLSLVKRDSSGTCYEIRDSHGNRVQDHDIYIGSIKEPDGLRGFAVSGAHYSEAGAWDDTPERRPGDLIRSISGGIPIAPYTMQVVESTAKGTGNYFHNTYMAAKRRESNYSHIFIPWYFIPHDTLAIPDLEEFARWLVEHRNDDQPNGNWLDNGKHYWWLWTLGATLEGINWYRYKRLTYDDYALMASEAPSDDIEAFQYSGSKVFDIRMVEDLRTRCSRPRWEGELVSDGFKGKDVLRNVHFVETHNGPLKIWQKPDDSPISNRYIVVVDIGGRSKNADWSVIRVIDRCMMLPEFEGVPEVVAQMRYHTDHDLLAFDAMRLAHWYNDALLVIESNTLETKDKERDVDGNMAEYILDIISKLYSNLYARKSKSEDINKGKPTKWGFHTNVDTKPKLISNLQHCLRESLWSEPSEIMCNEMEIYEKTDAGVFQATPGTGNHDDVLMATAIGLWICFREMEPPRWKDEKRTRKKDIDINSTVNI